MDERNITLCPARATAVRATRASRAATYNRHSRLARIHSFTFNSHLTIAMHGTRRRRRRRSPSTEPSSPEPPSDTEALSYFERAVAADRGKIQRRASKSPGRYRLISQLEPAIIKILLKYARGKCEPCYHIACGAPIDLSAALKRLKACETCRAAGAIESKLRRARANENSKDNKKVRHFADGTFVVTYCARTYQTRRRTRASAPSPSDHAGAPSQVAEAADKHVIADEIEPVGSSDTAGVRLLIATRPKTPEPKTPELPPRMM